MTNYTSQYTGVRSERNRWRADIQVNGKKKFLGYFTSEAVAAQAYNDAVTKMGLNRKLNIIASTGPVVNPNSKANGIQCFSGKSVLFQALGITSTSVEVSHGTLLTLRDAIKQVINNFLQAKKGFSAYDVTRTVRQGSNAGDFALTDCPFSFNNNWYQKISHDEVRDIVNELWTDHAFNAKKVNNGIYTSYQP